MANKIETLLMGVGNVEDVCNAACADAGCSTSSSKIILDAVCELSNCIEHGLGSRKAATLSVVALLNKINAGGGSLWYLSPEGAICRETFPNGVLAGIVERLLL